MLINYEIRPQGSAKYVPILSLIHEKLKIGLLYD